MANALLMLFFTHSPFKSDKEKKTNERESGSKSVIVYKSCK